MADTLEVRSFSNGYMLAFVGRRDGRIVRDRPVLDECGGLLTFPTPEAANDVRKETMREFDAWVKRATEAQILARLEGSK